MALRCLSCDIVLMPDEAVTGYCPTCEQKFNVATTSLPLGARIPCPHCHVETDSMKYYTMPIFLFVFVAWMSWSKDEIACPGCMRGKIAGYGALNIVTANVNCCGNRLAFDARAVGHASAKRQASPAHCQALSPGGRIHRQ